jgi:uncharacterized protein YyaL (SSP411 family)
VLLSVGYISCHWCHVMAHESFEDDATAAVMNERFVNVKVDREERPDVDAVYMEAVQAMTGQGGWPMTVFITPDGEPFYGGTYFPKVGRPGMPSFTDLLLAIDDAWRTRRDDLLEQAKGLTEAISATTTFAGAGHAAPGVELVAQATAGVLDAVDLARGGVGRAPKFPQTMALDLLLRAHARTGDPALLHAVQVSLDAMASGGIYDHLGGGFARYSVDDVWLVPHFEKMLYDQALLVRVYLHAWQATRNPVYLQVVDETIAYVLRDLCHADGGLFSAEDADSEGEEGRFYVWSLDEVREVCGDDAPAAIRWWGITEHGSFAESEGAPRANILARWSRGDLLRPEPVERARVALFARRATRVRPGLDDKVLTEWNALFVAALAEAAAATGRDDWRDAATRTADFLFANLRRDDGRWIRRSRHARRRVHPSRRGDGRGALDRAGEGRRRRPAGPVRRRRARRSLHHGPRRRAAGRPPEGPPRRRDAVGQQHGGGRAAAARGADRRRRARRARPSHHRPHGRRACSPPDVVRPPPRRHRPRRRADGRDRRRRRPSRPRRRRPPAVPAARRRRVG